MQKSANLQKALLICGILSSLLYVVTDIVSVVMWRGYDYSSQTVSELFALGAPTRTFVVISFVIYALLIFAFGRGVWVSANGNKKLKIAAALIVGKEILGLVGTAFFPIHLRGVEGNYSDVAHGIVTGAGVFIFMFPAMVAGALAFKGSFRIFSFITILLFIVFGVMSGLMAPALAANLPTPYLGIWERIKIYGYMLWIVILSIKLLGWTRKHQESKIPYLRKEPYPSI